MRVRDVANRRERLAFDAAEQAKQDAAAKEVRSKRKAELRAHLDRVALYHENTSHLPAQHKRSRVPEISLRAGDETILVELNSELLAEIAGPVDPAQAQEENHAEYLKRSRKVADAWCASEPAYYKSSANGDAVVKWLNEHPEHRADNLETYNECFTVLMREGKLEKHPQPNTEDKARAYYEVVAIHAFGRDYTAADLEALSADEYARVMHIPKRAPLGSLLRPKASH